LSSFPPPLRGTYGPKAGLAKRQRRPKDLSQKLSVPPEKARTLPIYRQTNKAQQSAAFEFLTPPEASSPFTGDLREDKMDDQPLVFRL
jgi:hypothetical protein